MILTTARLANLILAGVLTGNEFGSRVIVHPAVSELPPQGHLHAEQALTRRYPLGPESNPIARDPGGPDAPEGREGTVPFTLSP